MASTLTPTFGFDDLPDFRGWIPGEPPPGPRFSFLEPGIEGERLRLTARVLTRTGVPIPDVRLEFWQADAAGKYDKTGRRLRGAQRTGVDGVFRLETIIPGYSGPIRRINYVAYASIRGRKTIALLTAAIYFATADELRQPVSRAMRPYVRPGAKVYGDDKAFLPLASMPIENGVRQASYDIVLDFD